MGTYLGEVFVAVFVKFVDHSSLHAKLLPGFRLLQNNTPQPSDTINTRTN